MPVMRSLLLSMALTLPATPAMAAPEVSTRLVECRSESCLLISGKRDDRAAAVTVNGRAVSVEGGHKWSVRLPVETLRDWSAPFARKVTVSVAGDDREVRLPIGLLGHDQSLAMLVVRVK